MVMLMLWIAGPNLSATSLEDIDVIKEYQNDGSQVTFMCRCGKVVIDDVRTNVSCTSAKDGYNKVTGREARPLDGKEEGAVIWPMGIESGERTEVVCDNLPKEKDISEVYTDELGTSSSDDESDEIEETSTEDSTSTEDNTSTEEETSTEDEEYTAMINDIMKVDSTLTDTKEKNGIKTNYYEDGTQEEIKPSGEWTQYFCKPLSGDDSFKVMDFVSSDANGNAERHSKFSMKFDYYMYDSGFNSSNVNDPNYYDMNKYMNVVGLGCDTADDTKKFKQMFDEKAIAIAEKDVYDSPFYIIPKYNLNKKDVKKDYYAKVPSKHKDDMKDFYFEDDKKKYKEIQTTDDNSEAYICDNGVPKNIIKENLRISDQSFTRTIAKQLNADSTLEKNATPKIVDDYLKAVGFRCEDADQAELLINTYEDYEFPSYEKALKGRSNLRKQVDAAYEEYGMKALANSPQENVNFVDVIVDWFANLFA